MTEQSLDDILNSVEPAEAPEVEEPKQEEPQAEAQAEPEGPTRDEHGRFTSKGDKQPETEEAAPPAAEDEPKTAPIAALKDERSKRQALEAELERLRAQYAQPQAQPEPVQQQGPPDRWEDPDGYDRWLIAQASHIAQEQAVHAVQTQRIYASAVAARGKYADYGDAHAVFGEMVQSNPALFQQMVNAPDPAEFAYQSAKTEMGIRSAGGLQGYIQQEAARLAAEQAAQQPNLADVADRLPQSLPPSISSDRSVGPRSGPQWSGPADLGDILR